MIVDCFTFYNELELLEIRLAELSGSVDWFVLVEAGETFSGHPKPFVYEANHAFFTNFLQRQAGRCPRLCHVKIPRFPAALSSWEREAYSRNALFPALQSLQLQNDDIVLLSDIDEIPRATAIVEGLAALQEDPDCRLVFTQALHYYYLNGRIDQEWQGTRMARYARLGAPQDLRASGDKVLPNAGWHFSYLGGPARIRDKIGAYAHTELNVPHFTEQRHLEDCVGTGKDLFGRSQSCRFVDLDASYPHYLLEQENRFAHLIRQATGIDEHPLRTEEKEVVEGSEPKPISSMPLSEINLKPTELIYTRNCQIPSDISEHLPFLFRLASTVSHITEFGTRGGASTSAFLFAQPQRLHCYDLERNSMIRILEEAAECAQVEFRFHQADVRQVEIEPTDLLFIDTWHVEQQMQEELRLHANKSRHYLVMHDTETFGHKGETEGHSGIWKAITAFVRDNPHWRLLNHFPHNNGLTVFVRSPLL